jgi:hypothetical protein
VGGTPLAWGDPGGMGAVEGATDPQRSEVAPDPGEAQRIERRARPLWKKLLHPWETIQDLMWTEGSEERYQRSIALEGRVQPTDPGVGDLLNEIVEATPQTSGMLWLWFMGNAGTAPRPVAPAPAGAAVAPVATPYGPAFQATRSEAMAARHAVAEGATLWRIGTTGRSAAAEAQFWSLEHPLSSGFAARYGIPAGNVARANFIESATLRPGTAFVTRVAPRVGSNPGGGIEVVVPPGGVTMSSFTSQ